MTATQWLEVLASFALQVLAVVVVCKLLTRAVERSADHCAIWTICFFSILVLAAADLALPRLHLVQPWAQVEPQTILAVGTAQSVIGRVLLAVWCTGAAASLINWIVRAYLVRRLLLRCDALPEKEVRSLINMAHLKLNCRKPPRILLSDDIEGPFCLQFHEPTVVLPRYLLSGAAEDLRHVLVHEIEHLTTNHPLHLFLQHVAQSVCWFHPFVWNASWNASMAREFSCDDAVAAQGSNCAAYLRTLLRIAERGELGKQSVGIAFGRAPRELVLRARRLVNAATNAPKRPRFVVLGRKTTMCILVCAVSVMAVVTIPLDALSSSRSVWSPWPRWTAQIAHCFGYGLRDYETFDRRVQLYELQSGDEDQVRLPNDLLVGH